MKHRKTAVAAAMIAAVVGGVLTMAGPAAAATAAPGGFHDNGFHDNGVVADPSGNPWHGAPGDGAVTPTGHDWSDGIGGDSVDPSGNPWHGAPGGDTVIGTDGVRYTCDGEVCIGVVPDGVVVPMDNSGCNHQVCVHVNVAFDYSASALGTGFYGHVDLWGPGMPRHGGPEGLNPGVSGRGSGFGTVCAEGWQKLGPGSYRSVGLPCVSNL